MATGMFENDTSTGNCLQQQPPGVPDSPDSIPLPDSPPPETEDRVVEYQEAGDQDHPPVDPVIQEDRLNPNNNIPELNNLNTSSESTSSNKSSGSSRRKSKQPRHAEEYDPSEPLTSSDEEEHSLQLIEGENENISLTDTQKNRNRSCSGNSNSNNNNNNSSVVELSRNTSPKPTRLSLCVTTPPPTSKSSSSSGNKSVSPKYPKGQDKTSSSSNNDLGRTCSIRGVDLTSIPVPPDENRRPTIHFSIPTRHRLLPISSLIKRQKGVARKDGRSDSQQGEGVKGLDKSLDADDEDEDDECEEGRPKISLVAEIFGNDDDEDEENEEETERQQQQSVESQGKGANDQVPAASPQTEGAAGGFSNNNLSDSDGLVVEGNSGRWKIVADEPIISISNNIIEPETSSPEQVTDKETEDNNPFSSALVMQQECENEGIENPLEDEPEIIEIVTLNVPPILSNRIRPLRRRPFLGRIGFENGGEPEVIDIVDKDDEEVEPLQQASSKSTSASSPLPQRRSSPSRNVSIERERERERSDRLRSERIVESSPERERHFKRPHSSSSMSNCEEGEIIDQVNPSKKRKKDRKKKAKRRKRSKESASPPPKSSEKRLSDIPSHASDHEEDTGGRGAISWRKPSKRTQNRNYRDGKPKTDDTFFREKETDDKPRSISPSHKRIRSRKDKSPTKEKASGRRRRDTSPRNRSHSKSPGRLSRSRSRSSGKPYRNRRKNRHSRSRSSHSLSDRSKSGRSTSRKRSRRRYRRSTSRHHVGDSRSPSYITEPIRSRSSHYSKLRDRTRSRSRDRHGRARYRKRSISRSRTPSPSARSHKKNRKPESIERQQRKKQLKEREKPVDESISDTKEKKKEKEKLKEKERRKKKEKPKEEEKVKPKEKVKEKEKKKKKKRREKSPTPVKAIVADGDSIVVSLSFQKGKTASSSSNAQPSCIANNDHSENGLDISANSESSGNQSSKTNVESEPPNDMNDEQDRSQNSPAKLSSVTDEDEAGTPPASCQLDRTKSNEEKETEAVKVTSSGGGSCGSNSPFETERSFSAAADSTKVVTPQPSEQHDNSSLNLSTRPSLSPTDMESSAQGDSLVTSTGDSIEQAANADEEAANAKSNSMSTPSKQPDGNNKAAVKVVATQQSPRVQGTQASATVTVGTTESGNTSNSITASTATVSNSQSGSSTAQPISTPTLPRPVIGNIPGLYPSSAIINSGGAVPVPPPIVIPTPPPPQGIRFSSGTGPMLNPNVLASVASALLAVRQNQPNMKIQGAPGGASTDNNASQLRHMSVLNSRTQTFPVQTNARNNASSNSFSGQDQGGDSPMSPNSSDGDDLFEPPIDRTQGEGASNGAAKVGKNGQLFGNPPLLGNSANDSYNAAGGNKTKGTVSLFDTLFGGVDPKKAPANKPEKIMKPKAKHRKVSAASKKETIKVNTSGGMTEGELRLTDEVPTSAVELIVKQKYLKKLNRQERVVEEVKLSLKPHYSKRHINKDEYKEILRRAVPKICHNKTGEINPGKIKGLVEAYVKKFRHARKRGDVSNAK